jgi:hypothetical protein
MIFWYSNIGPVQYIEVTYGKQSNVVPLREALNMEIMINQALIDLLVAKGIITQEELMAKIEELRQEMPKVTF